MLSAAILSQCLIYPRGSIGDQKHLRRWSLNLTVGLSCLILLTFAVEVSIDESNSSNKSNLFLPYLLQTQMVAAYCTAVAHIARYLP